MLEKDGEYYFKQYGKNDEVLISWKVMEERKSINVIKRRKTK